MSDKLTDLPPGMREEFDKMMFGIGTVHLEIDKLIAIMREADKELLNFPPELLLLARPELAQVRAFWRFIGSEFVAWEKRWRPILALLDSQQKPHGGAP